MYVYISGIFLWLHYEDMSPFLLNFLDHLNLHSSVSFLGHWNIRTLQSFLSTVLDKVTQTRTFPTSQRSSLNLQKLFLLHSFWLQETDKILWIVPFRSFLSTQTSLDTWSEDCCDFFLYQYRSLPQIVPTAFREFWAAPGTGEACRGSGIVTPTFSHSPTAVGRVE